MYKEFFHSFAIASPSNATHQKKGDEKLHFFHVAHFSAAFIPFFVSFEEKLMVLLFEMHCKELFVLDAFSRDFFLMTVFYHMHGAFLSFLTSKMFLYIFSFVEFTANLH